MSETAKTAKTAKGKPRRRMDAATARALILDATERRLVVAGPAGIRLHEVAADAGVSHPTVLHHFGSRALLVKAVISRSTEAINKALVQGITASGGDEEQFEDLLEKVAVSLASSGHGRVIMWLALEGHRIDEAEARLRDVVDATHALRLARFVKGKKKPTREDTAHAIVLAALALVGGTVIGASLLDNAGAGGDPAAERRFRRWLARLLRGYFEA